MKSARIWLSYDLSFGSGYDNLYAFLDDYGAKECGNSVAVFDFSYDGDLFEELSKDIEAKIKPAAGDRYYFMAIDTHDNALLAAKFIFGKRKKNSPWKGYAPDDVDVDDFVKELMK